MVVFKNLRNVVLVYIVVYGGKEINGIVLVLNLILLFRVIFEEKDYLLIVEDVLKVWVRL